LRSIIRIEAARNESPHDLLCATHAALRKDIPDDMFVTLFYAVLDPGARRLCYCCAGHNPAYLYNPGTGALRPLKSGGQPLGVSFFGEQAFSDGLREETQAFDGNDVFVVYTDGVTEAVNPRREQFGEERVEDIIRKCGRGDPKDMKLELATQLEAFTGKEPQFDDITFVIVQNTATGEST
jgi:sigma-B regulation protein RsbU (phosphoserine phosphatase)